MDSTFDRIIPRRGTNSIKYDGAAKRGLPEDLLPLWVADMDFMTLPEVVQALEERARHGIFGYTEPGDSYWEALSQWYSGRFGWTPDRSWLVPTPGVVYALCTAVRAFSAEGDCILIQQPVYYPFSSSVTDNNRRLVVSNLVYRDGSYEIDFDDFEEKIATNRVKMFILCSPHNPVGRVWTREELVRMGDICCRYGVLVVSDEIHSDFVYPGSKHLVFASLKPEFEAITVTCTAPSKTFNLAGLQISNIFISHPILRRQFMRELNRTGYSQLNSMGIVACEAAYRFGGPWLNSLLAYLLESFDEMDRFIKGYMPGISLVRPQGTYLAWLDCTSLPFTEEERQKRIIEGAKLWLDKGTMFGKNGAGFERINIACPRSVVMEALQRLKDALYE